MEPKLPTRRPILRRVVSVMVPAMALPAITYAPGLNPLHLPRVDLTGFWAMVLWTIAESGSARGLPWIAAALIVLLVTRPELTAKQRRIEAVVLTVSLLVMLGGGSYLNEFVVKPMFGVYRPNIIALSQQPPDAPRLKLSAAAFYDLSADARSDHMDSVLDADVPLHEWVRHHWVATIGYSFPSGHAFASMFFATFFLAQGLTHCSGRRLWALYLLVPWAVAVCFSRPLLRVHSPTDVCVGALVGFTGGLLTYFLAHRWSNYHIHPVEVRKS